jgi:dTDP-D-glucose 4,6-dehydratase
MFFRKVFQTKGSTNESLGIRWRWLYRQPHVVRQLGEAGHDIVVIDNLSTGHEWAISYGKLEKGDLADVDFIQQVFARENFEAVLHFAAAIVVPESVSNPLKYYGNNTRNTLNLLTHDSDRYKSAPTWCFRRRQRYMACPKVKLKLTRRHR